MVPGIGDRLLTLTETVSGPAYAADASLVERQQLQLVAWGVFRENILFGAGPNSFATVMREYAPLTSAGSTGDVTAVVNLYLEIAAETGLVGLAGWIVFVGGTVVLSTLALIRLAEGRQDGSDGSPTRSLAAGTTAALIGWSVVSVTLQMSYARTLLTLCALIGLLYSATREDPGPTDTGGTRRQEPRGDGFALRHAGGPHPGRLLGAGRDHARERVEHQHPCRHHRADAPGRPGDLGGYATDVRRRVPVLPAYAAVIQQGSPQPETTVDADPVRGVITVRAVGATTQEAQARRDAVVDDAPGVIQRAGMDRAYRVVPVTTPGVTTERVLPSSGLRLVVLAVLLDVALVLAIVARVHRRRRQDRQPAVRPPRSSHEEPVGIPAQRARARP